MNYYNIQVLSGMDGFAQLVSNTYVVTTTFVSKIIMLISLVPSTMSDSVPNTLSAIEFLMAHHLKHNVSLNTYNTTTFI